jgi:thiol-disulfide isomerase/thioredoxin
MRCITLDSFFCRFLPLLLVTLPETWAGDFEIRGRVVDEAGVPVAGACVDYFWRANGSGTGSDGKTLDLTKEENVRLFWSHLGEMESAHPVEAKTGADGRFSLKMPEIYYAVMAMDRSRRRGGLVVLPKENERAPVEIRIGPVVRVRGKFDGPVASQPSGWTHVYTLVPPDPTRPLHSNRLVSCGSFEGRFEMSLPPGRYFLHGYNERFDAALIPDREIVLSAREPEVDLGVLRLSPSGPTMEERIKRSKASGAWGDYQKHYGQPAPRWHVTDARGVHRAVQLSDFKGKWVLLDFWGFGCRPCLWIGLPKLVRFYEEHGRHREQFEILAICLDYEGEMKTMADVDRRLAPIVEHVWGGKPLPFPVVLDSSFETLENFGLQGLGTVLLIDPEGNLVRGDETVLAEKFNAKQKKNP